VCQFTWREEEPVPTFLYRQVTYDDLLPITEQRPVFLCILTNKVFRGLEILVQAVGFDVVGDQLADPVLVRQLVRVRPRLNLHLLAVVICYTFCQRCGSGIRIFSFPDPEKDSRSRICIRIKD
jgi:hypothetical protein